VFLVWYGFIGFGLFIRATVQNELGDHRESQVRSARAGGVVPIAADTDTD